MYIHPFLAGVLTTIGVELILIVAWAAVIAYQTSKKEDK